MSKTTKKRNSSSKSIIGSSRNRSVSDTTTQPTTTTTDSGLVCINMKMASIRTPQKQQHGGSLLPSLSLSSLDNLDHISSSSSSSVITPKTKSNLISIKSTDDIRDYGFIHLPKSKEEEEAFKDIKNTKYDTFEPYRDGLIRTNKYYFTEVQFCFICDTDTIKFQSNACIEKTGIRLNKMGVYEPTYKQIFCCDDCYSKIQDMKRKNNDYNIIIYGKKALNYY
jgi:hypothetical protein